MGFDEVCVVSFNGGFLVVVLVGWFVDVKEVNKLVL